MGQHLESKPDRFISTHCTLRKQSCSSHNVERWDETLPIYTSHCSNPINILKNVTFQSLVYHQTPILQDLDVLTGAYIYILRHACCQNYQLLQPHDRSALSPGSLFCDKLFLPFNPSLTVLWVNRVASPVKLIRDASVLFCLFHAFINFIVGLYIIMFFFYNVIL